MTTLSEPDEPNGLDTLILSKRTDGRDHAEFDYDPDTGIELPPCKHACVMAASKSPDEAVRRRAAAIRWRAFHLRFRAAMGKALEDMQRGRAN